MMSHLEGSYKKLCYLKLYPMTFLFLSKLCQGQCLTLSYEKFKKSSFLVKLVPPSCE